MPAIGVLMAWLGSQTARVFAEKLLVWIAFKAFMIFLFVIIAPLVLNNFLYDIIDIVKNFAATQAVGSTSLNGGMNYTGLMAWLIEKFRLAECVSVLINAVVLRQALRMVPFIRMG